MVSGTESIYRGDDLRSVFYRSERPCLSIDGFIRVGISNDTLPRAGHHSKVELILSPTPTNQKDQAGATGQPFSHRWRSFSCPQEPLPMVKYRAAVWSSASDQNESLMINLGGIYSVNSPVLATRPPSDDSFSIEVLNRGK